MLMVKFIAIRSHYSVPFRCALHIEISLNHITGKGGMDLGGFLASHFAACQQIRRNRQYMKSCFRTSPVGVVVKREDAPFGVLCVDNFLFASDSWTYRRAAEAVGFMAT